MGDALWFAAALVGLLGLAIGSFLNVVIWRVPRGESIVRPRSHCPVCDHPVRPRDEIPVLSWLLLRGRCRDCGASIAWRYPLVEALTGVLFAVVTLVIGVDWVLPAWLYLAAVGTALAVIDIDHHRLPDVLTLPSYPVAGVLLLIPAAVQGDWGAYLRCWLAAAALFAFYLLLAVVYPAGMGFGDVKLAGVLGLYLGWLGWDQVVIGTFAGFLLGAVVGVALMATGRSGRKSAIPFGPFMLVGVLLALLLGTKVSVWYAGVLIP